MLSIKRLESGLYEASATPPHIKVAWASAELLHARQLIQELEDRGCHQRDIGDLMYEQDPSWMRPLETLDLNHGKAD